MYLVPTMPDPVITDSVIMPDPVIPDPVVPGPMVLDSVIHVPVYITLQLHLTL